MDFPATDIDSLQTQAKGPRSEYRKAVLQSTKQYLQQVSEIIVQNEQVILQYTREECVRLLKGTPFRKLDYAFTLGLTLKFITGDPIGALVKLSPKIREVHDRIVQTLQEEFLKNDSSEASQSDNP